MSFRRAWQVCGWCTRQGCRVSLWLIWLVLIAALAGQLHLISARRVPVPEPLRRLIEHRLASHGVHLDYGRARMNLTGRFLLEDVRLGPVDANAPLASARSVYLHFNRWELLGGKLHLDEVRVAGLDLLLPPDLVSDSPPADNIDFGLRLEGREIELSYFTGYIDRLPVQASGRFRAPPAAPAPESAEDLAERITQTYLDIAGRVRAASPWLAAARSPAVSLRLTPDTLAVDLRADAVDLAALPQPQVGKLTSVHLRTTLSFDASQAEPITLDARVRSAMLPLDIAADGVAFRLRATPGGALGLDLLTLDLQLGSVRWRNIAAGPLAATITQPTRDQFHADISLALAGSSWRVQGRVAPRDGLSRVELDGFVGDTTLAFAGNLIGKDLTTLLDPAVAAPLHVSATFGPDWKLGGVAGRLHSGSVRVGGAQLDETGTEFTYDGVRVLCDHLVLRQGESLAHGSYEMDTRTMDFRFLLTGGLRPEGIESWFHDWWSNFWSTFDFSRGLPDADVDVRGRWGDLTATRVFVQAEGEQTGLRGVGFDRVRTRLFLRPHWFDILHFDVLQTNQTARGWLTRSLDATATHWHHMEFDVESTLPLETIATLFKEESASLLAPYRFATPPSLRLSGRVHSDHSPAGKKEHIDITLGSEGPMTYHDFPLSDLTFEALLRDDHIDLPTLTVGFAEGKARGNARLWIVEQARRLAFDITLVGANLGAAIDAVALIQPPASASAPAPTGKSAEAARERQQRLDQGHLSVTLAAEGLYDDFHSFKGLGRAAITGAELAQLNLFGPLSELLSGTHFSFGSFSLDTVHAPFLLERDRLRFEDLRVTGPSALLQAKGNYHLRESRLDFTTKIHPFDESSSIVGNAVGFFLSPLSKVFEVKLQGTLAKPKWIFAYGPSRLLNTLTGAEDQTPLPAPLAPVAPMPPRPNDALPTVTE